MAKLDKAKVKLIGALVLIAVVLVIVFQNTEPVATRLLFVTVTMPRAALLATTMLIGVAIGMLIALTISGRKSMTRDTAAL